MSIRGHDACLYLGHKQFERVSQCFLKEKCPQYLGLLWAWGALHFAAAVHPRLNKIDVNELVLKQVRVRTDVS